MLQSNGKALQCNTDVTPSNKNVTTEKEKEKEKELELELDSKSIDKEKNQTDGQALSKFSKIYEKRHYQNGLNRDIITLTTGITPWGVNLG